MRKGLTAIEVVVAIVALVLLVGMLVPFLGQKTHCGSGGKEAVNLQNIQRSMETYASSNKGYCPGLNSAGDYLMNGLNGKFFTAPGNASTVAEEKSGDGCSIATGTNLAMACLLEDMCVVPSQLISPGETNPAVTEVSSASAAGAAVPVQDCHCSHAMLAYGKKSLKPEWGATSNPQAVVLASRLMFGGHPGEYNSVWTDAGSGRWMGWTVRNDGSTEWARKTLLGRSYEFLSFSKGAVDCFGNLKYGAGAPFDAATESSSTVGIFGRSTDMKNFDASAAAGQIGSAND